MKTFDKDILKELPQLKQMPYEVPEGYFEAFKGKATAKSHPSTGILVKIVPYLATAAAFLFLVTAGTFLLERVTPEQEFSQEDYLVFSDNIVNTIAMQMEYGDQIAEAEIDDEDIINYLIDNGITAEEVEYSK